MARYLYLSLLALACSTPPQPTRATMPDAFAEREAGPPPAPQAGLPNVVLILTDDHRLDQGADIMPLLRKQLADSGVSFAKGLHTGTVCCNSRADLYSGQAQHIHGVLDNYGPSGGAPAFNHAQTVAADLHAAGYLTALVGKYLNNTEAMGPLWTAPGWDEWRVFKEGGSGSPLLASYYNYTLTEKAFGTGLVADSAYGSAKAHYSTTVLRRKALDFLKRAPLTQPVFLVVAPYAPHTAVSVLPQDAGKCNGYMFAEAPSSNEADVSDKPAYVQAKRLLTPAQVAGSQASRRKQCEALQAVDRLVNDVVSNLRLSGRLANTLLIFTGDNGFMWNEHRLKNRKHTVYMEGLTTPLYIRGPGVAMGAVDTSLVHITDLTETIRQIAGLAPGPQHHGVSLVPLLAAPNVPWTTELLLENLVLTPAAERFAAIRTAQFVYAEYPAGGPGGTPFMELYDLAVDPWQMTNVASDPAYAATVATLQARLAIRSAAP